MAYIKFKNEQIRLTPKQFLLVLVLKIDDFTVSQIQNHFWVLQFQRTEIYRIVDELETMGIIVVMGETKTLSLHSQVACELSLPNEMMRLIQ